MNRTYGMVLAMRATALILGVFAAMLAFVADVYPTLPPVEFLDTEVVTNVSISTPAQGGREYFFELAFVGSASNNVEIAFGEDADGDGVLSFEEVSLSAGTKRSSRDWQHSTFVQRSFKEFINFIT